MGTAISRKLLVIGAHAVLHHLQPHADALRSRAKKLMETKSFKLVGVAGARKLAHTVFAVLPGGESFTPMAAA